MSTAAKIRRPALRYFGAKFRLAKWIISHFPAHDVYAEPFAGSGAVLLRKQPSPLEVYNDADEEVVNFFRVMREQPADLIRAIRLTPFSRTEWEQAYEPTDDPIEQARRLYVRAWQAFGSSGLRRNGTGWRSEKTTLRGKRIIDDWNETNHLWAIAERLGQVQIESGDALEVIRRYDKPETLFYCDPPYLAQTRQRKRGYIHEMASPEEHEALADCLNSIEGMAALSGYPSSLYVELFEDRGWKCVSKSSRTMAPGTSKRECLWLSPALQHRMGGNLFSPHTTNSQPERTL